MNHWQAVRLITGWEFRRFLKVRELVVMIVMIVAFGVGIPFVMDLVGSRGDAPVTIAVTGGEAPPSAGRFEYLPQSSAEAAEALADGDVDAILDLSNVEAPVLTLEEESAWIPALNEQLVESALDSRLAAAGIAPADFRAALAPVDLEIVLTEPGSAPGALVILMVAGALIFAVFIGSGLLFTAITGEKTQRITEQIVSAVSPQAWIDGKVLGTSLYVLVNMACFALGLAIAVVVNMLIAEGSLPPLPPLTISPLVLLVALLFAVLGGALYFMLFAAVAATIDDPATSQRSGMIMLPAMFVGLSFLGLVGSVDNLFFRFLSHFPLTSPSAMPIRLLLGDAGAPEALISFAILLASVLFARMVAGRIFALGILMTGKEPSFREMFHWFRRAA